MPQMIPSKDTPKSLALKGSTVKNRPNLRRSAKNKNTIEYTTDPSNLAHKKKRMHKTGEEI